MEKPAEKKSAGFLVGCGSSSLPIRPVEMAAYQRQYCAQPLLTLGQNCFQ